MVTGIPWQLVLARAKGAPVGEGGDDGGDDGREGAGPPRHKADVKVFQLEFFPNWAAISPPPELLSR